MTRITLASAIEEAAARDPVLSNLVSLVGVVKHRPRSADGPFGALARAIVFQQLAGRAAQAILGRVVDTAGGHLTADALIRTSDEALRAAGLSANKLASLRDLTVKVLDGTVDFARFAHQSDVAIIDRLISVRGIGRWTAEMFLMFELRRLDVWPVDDLGVRQGYGLAWGIDPPPTPKPLLALGEPFRPYRSILARYCWEAVALYRGGTDPSLRQIPTANERNMHTNRHTPANEARADRILDDVRAIPKGRVSTYGDVSPGAPRLVGQMLATAPHDVPWHRVVRADGTIPMGSAQLARLVDEGVPTRGDRVDMKRARWMGTPTP
jgi:DNA-3-methyladenine glycosylase II